MKLEFEKKYKKMIEPDTCMLDKTKRLELCFNDIPKSKKSKQDWYKILNDEEGLMI